ncbi:MAG: cold shock domain-containing protein [Acidobacteriota bacterium]|nr:cold shock domain-containing protein [Acidobacteriota bacterium]
MNARQKRLFEDALKKNPNMKMPVEGALPAGGDLTDEDMALLKQGVGDKSGRPQSAAATPSAEGAEEGSMEGQTGSVMTYFEEKGFGFLRPDGGGKDIFFHISRLHQGQATELVAGTKVSFDLGMDRNGKIAASSVRILPPPGEAPPPAAA